MADNGSIFAGCENIGSTTRDDFVEPEALPELEYYTTESSLAGLRHHVLMNAVPDKLAVIEYLVRLAGELGMPALTKLHASANIKIADKDATVTPLSWLRLKPVQDPKGSKYKDGEATAAYDQAALIRIFWPIRLNRAHHTEQKQQLREKGDAAFASALPEGAPKREIGDMIPPWVEEIHFERIAAAYDAFWFVFSGHPLAVARIGTLALRDRELNTQASVCALIRKLGMTAQDMSYWMWTNELADQFERCFLGPAGAAKYPEALIHYARPFGMCEVSPLAMNGCPELYFLVHTVGLTCGLARSENAGYPKDVANVPVLKIAELMALNNHQFTGGAPRYRSDAQGIEDAIQESLSEEAKADRSDGPTNGSGWFALRDDAAAAKRGHDHMKSKLKGYPAGRDKTILQALKKQYGG